MNQDVPSANDAILAQVKSTLPMIYYDHQRNSYWYKAEDSKWILLNESSVKRHLKASGYNGKAAKDEPLSEVDRLVAQIQEKQHIQFAGPLAGYAEGVYNFNESRVLVTESPKFIIPTPVRWDTLRGILDRMLGPEQLIYFHGWMKMAQESLVHGTFRPGQVLFIAGPANCGKSLIQNLITIFLGSRSAKPYQYMTGATSFNADLFGAEHLMIEDEAAFTDLRSRRTLGANIKSFTVNQDQRCHGKNKQPVILRPFFRVTMTANNEPENLMVMAPIDESLEDKVMMFKAFMAEMPIDTSSLEGRSELWDALVSDLNGYAWWLNHQYEIPDNLVCARFGIKHYHHPEILGALDEMAPENKLFDLINTQIFPEGQAWETGVDIWKGTASELESALCGKESTVDYEAKRLFSWSSACGAYLARLAKKYPKHFQMKRTNSIRYWEIRNPKTL